MLNKIPKRYWIASLVVVGVVLFYLFSTRQESTAEVKTRTGLVQGILQEGVQAFLGIPYAAPPVGDLRWSYPHNMPYWQGVLQANQVPPHCVQTLFGITRGQEDCLYLNIWTPDIKPEKPLPVMIWFHGGGYIVGHSHETTPGQRLAKEGNVIVVSVNYRLGALGFMAHPLLTAAEGSSGNYGLLDQIYAIKWIQRNIPAFGGDRNNITIFGESAGGMSVCNLLASPYIRGHFHKAIIQSGPCFSPYPDLAFMEKQGQEMEKKLGCDLADNKEKLLCMRSKTPDAILAAMPPDPGMVFGEDAALWMPNIDGKVLVEQPLETLREGRFAQVPVINGNNADEGSLMVMFGHEYQFRSVDETNYADRIRYLVRDDDKVKKVMERYPISRYENAGDALAAVFADHSFVCHEKWTSDALARKSPVYSYYFSYPDADFVLPELRTLGAFHSAEVQFLFNDSMAWFETTFSGDEKMLSDNMIHYWTQFAHTGDPNGTMASRRTATEWPLYNKDRQRLQLDIKPGIKPAADTDDTCRFWDEMELDRFTP